MPRDHREEERDGLQHTQCHVDILDMQASTYVDMQAYVDYTSLRHTCVTHTFTQYSYIH
jgi:hypothetical protein